MKKHRIFVICSFLGIMFLAGCKESGKNVSNSPSPIPTITKTEEGEVTKRPESTKKPEQQSYELLYSYREETTQATEGEEIYFTSCILCPEFEGEGAEVVNVFVEKLTEEFRVVLSESEECAKLDYEDSKVREYPDSFFPEVEELTIRVLWQDEDRMVLHAQYYSYMGGAHPNNFGFAYVINKKDGTQIEIEKVLNDYGLSAEAVAEYAVAQFKEIADDVLYEMDDKNGLKNFVLGFIKGNQWYLTENGLVIFANPYDIAPYAYGVIECEIPYADLEQGLKND